MKFFPRNALLVLALVLCWRVLLLVFTAQPIPANDAFGFDGAIVNLLHGGNYCNLSYALIFPIAGKQIYAVYPPAYQGALLIWMKLFGTSVISSMALHLTLFAVSSLLTLAIIRKFFPAVSGLALVALLFFGFTFGDRPESLGYIFGLGSLWLVARQLSEPGFHLGMAAGLLVLLWLTLYTSVIVGAYFFGVGFLTCAIVFLWRPNWLWFVPFLGAAALFAAVTLAIAKWEPLWWASFMENARQQSVMSGFHAPNGTDLLKMIRTTPVFLLALVVVPSLIVARWKELPESPWLALSCAILVMGWVMQVVALTLLAANYIYYVFFTQILLAAGMLALVEKYVPARGRWLRTGVVVCVLLVSVRAVGMTTWGAACAWKNSYHQTETALRTEFQPFVASDQPLVVSSAFLYEAAEVGIKNPVLSDWYFDHSHWTNNAQAAALEHLRPPKLVLTQFDYYRSFAVPLAELQQHPELVAVHVRDFARMPVPDASPSLQRVLQHISWAPVIVDFDWKP